MNSYNSQSRLIAWWACSDDFWNLFGNSKRNFKQAAEVSMTRQDKLRLSSDVYPSVMEQYPRLSKELGQEMHPLQWRFYGSFVEKDNRNTCAAWSFYGKLSTLFLAGTVEMGWRQLFYLALCATFFLIVEEIWHFCTLPTRALRRPWCSATDILAPAFFVSNYLVLFSIFFSCFHFCRN